MRSRAQNQFSREVALAGWFNADTRARGLDWARWLGGPAGRYVSAAAVCDAHAGSTSEAVRPFLGTGQMGLALVGSLQMSNVIFFDRGTFWVLPLTYFIFSKVPGRTFFPNLSNFTTFAAAPLISVDPIRPQPTSASSIAPLLSTIYNLQSIDTTT